MNITDALLSHSQEIPSIAAIELGDLSNSFYGLYALVENCKHKLVSAGIQPGETAVLVLPSNPQHLVLILGLAAIGVTIVALPVAFIRTEGEVDKQQLLRYCAQRLGNRAPKDIVRVSEMPLNERGKILKRALRESYLQKN
jgi:acyl-CoA synthetase (AMP-forming)/AMP-acid ligase II